MPRAAFFDFGGVILSSPFEDFCDLFEAECTHHGHTVAAREVMPLLAGEIRPAMVQAVRRFYELACAVCGVQPREAVFLDDLGVNLKPAAAMGMTTIKVLDPGQALAELEQLVGVALR